MSITIVIDGATYAGWTKATVKRDIKAMSGSFTMAIAFEGANFITQVVGARPIKKGAECQVMIAGKLAVTGTIEKRKSKGSKTSYVLNIEGRSKTKKALKSSPKTKSIQFNNMKRTDIIKKLATELGINVIDKSGGDSGKVQRHILGDGETTAQAIYTIGRDGGLQISDDPEGNMVILNPDGDGQGEPLVLGVNIESWDANLSEEDEVKDYQAVGHSIPNDNKYGKAAMDIASKAVDEVFKSPELRRLRIDGDVDLDTLKKRALLEARRSKADSNEVSITTKNITQGDGELWTPNKKHHIDIWVDEIDRVMLLKSVEWSFSKEECSVSLTFTIDKGYANTGGKGAKGGSKKSSSDTSATGSQWESPEVSSQNESG